MTKKIISEHDINLFRDAVGKVESVKSDKIHPAPANRPKPYPKPNAHLTAESFPESFIESIDHVSHEESLHYTAPGVQKNVLTKLRKGFFGVQAELDLHGLNTDEAKRQLSEFLSAGKQAGFRCVHIIHGKGYRSSDAYPILKNHLNQWLRQYPDILAFCSAPQRHGGAGAVFVLLKTNPNDRF